jgi:hypothetical protein
MDDGRLIAISLGVLGGLIISAWIFFRVARNNRANNSRLTNGSDVLWEGVAFFELAPLLGVKGIRRRRLGLPATTRDLVWGKLSIRRDSLCWRANAFLSMGFNRAKGNFCFCPSDYTDLHVSEYPGKPLGGQLTIHSKHAPQLVGGFLGDRSLVARAVRMMGPGEPSNPQSPVTSS